MASALTRIIDAHHHLWDLAANYYPWLTDRIGPRMYGDYAAIRRNYLVDDFRRDIGSVPVVKSVHVQAEHDHSDPVRETRWLQAEAERCGFPHAIIAYADLSAPRDRLEALLDAHCAFANVRGVRQMVHEVLLPDMRHPIDHLADERWQRNLSILAQALASFRIADPAAPGRGGGSRRGHAPAAPVPAGALRTAARSK